MASEWYIKVADEQIGPLTSRQLKAMADEGQLGPEGTVRPGGDGPWVPAGRVRGLFSHTPTAPAEAGDGEQQEDASPSAESTSTVSNDQTRRSVAPPGPPVQEPGQVVTYPVAEPLDPSAFAGREIPVATPVSIAPETTNPAGPLPPSVQIPGGSATGSSGPPPTIEPDAPSAAPPFEIQAALGPPAMGVTAGHGRSDSSGAHRFRTGARRRRRQNAAIVAVSLILVAAAGVVAVFKLSNMPTGEDPQTGKRKTPRVSGRTVNRRDIDMPEVDDLLAGGQSSSGASALARSGSASSDTPEGAWVDAVQDVYVRSGMVVELVTAEIGERFPSDRKEDQRNSRAGDECLTVRLELSNRNGRRVIDYTGWATSLYRDKVKLEDGRGQSCSMKSLPAASVPGQQRQAAIKPSSSVTDVLVFERPPETAKQLKLSLPATAFGGKGTVRFQIPMAMVVDPTGQPVTMPSASGPLGDRGGSDLPAASHDTMSGAPRLPGRMDGTSGALQSRPQPTRRALKADSSSLGNQVDGGPIDIPGLHDKDSGHDEKDEAASFEGDPEMMKMGEEARLRNAEQRRKQQENSSSAGRRASD